MPMHPASISRRIIKNSTIISGIGGQNKDVSAGFDQI
jgi:hypothetical protein